MKIVDILAAMSKQTFKTELEAHTFLLKLLGATDTITFLEMSIQDALTKISVQDVIAFVIKHKESE